MFNRPSNESFFVGAISVGWSDVYPEMTPLSGTKPPGKPCLAWRETDSHAAVQRKQSWEKSFRCSTISTKNLRPSNKPAQNRSFLQRKTADPYL